MLAAQSNILELLLTRRASFYYYKLTIY